MSQNFIFSYGSLVSKESREKSGKSGVAIPVVVSGIRRGWNFVPKPEGGVDPRAIALGAMPESGAHCNGVIFPAELGEIREFDSREFPAGYRRVELNRDTVIRLDREKLPKGTIYAYVAGETGETSLAGRSIVQSYVDVVMLGFLSFGESFARDFVAMTNGWDLSWENDRLSPRYPRPLTENTHVGIVDKILAKEIPQFFLQRAFDNPNHFLKDHGFQNIPLNFEEAYFLGVYALEGCRGNLLAQKQSIAMMCALHPKATYAYQRTPEAQKFHPHHLPENAAEQVAGVCGAIFQHDIAASEFGFVEPDVPYAMDNCGMGGDLLVTANVSTLAALIAATAGIPMCKHGSPANADGGRHGSSDFVSETLGIETYPSKEALERCVATEHFGYIEAFDTRYKQIHQQTRHARLAHMNDIIGPITSPVHPRLLTKRVVGLNQLIPPRIVAEAYRILNERGITNLRHGLFVRGFADEARSQGIDEVSICPGGTQVAELRDGEIREFTLYAEDFGLSPVLPESISLPKGMSKGEFSLKILNGEIAGPPLQMVLANASLLFVLAGPAPTYRRGYELAAEVFASGLVAVKVDRIRSVLAKSSKAVG